MLQSIRRERELLAATRGSVLDPAIANKILDDLFSSFVLLTGRDEHELPALLDPEWFAARSTVCSSGCEPGGSRALAQTSANAVRPVAVSRCWSNSRETLGDP